MRRRKWALFAFISMLAFIFISLESWRLFKANEKLKDFILAEFRPIVGDQLQISKVHVSFGNIHIMDVRFQSPKNDIAIDIRDLRIGYNFFNLMIRGFDPQYISQDALFIGPTITFYANPDTLPKTKPAQVTRSPKYDLIAPNLKELDLFSYISIKDGEIVYAKNDSSVVRLVQSVQGGIYRQKADSLYIDLDGTFYDSEKQNIQIVGHGDYKTQRVSKLRATLTNYELRHGLPLIDSTFFSMNEGSLAGHVEIGWQDNLNRYGIDGSVKIDSAAGQMLDGKMAIRQLFSEILIKNDRLIIKKSSQNVNNSDIAVTGTLENLNDPVVDLEVESLNFKIGRFSPIFDQSIGPITGESRLQASIVGPLNDIKVTSFLRSHSLKVDNLTVKNFYANTIYNGSSLRVDSCAATIFDNSVTLSGMVDLASDDKLILGRLSASGSPTIVSESIGLDSSIVLFTDLSSYISGSLKDPVLQGTAYIHAIPDGGDSLHLATIFHVQDKHLTLETEPQHNGFYVNTSVDWRSNPAVIAAEIRQPEQLIYFFRPESDFFVNNLQSFLSVSGTLEQFTVETDVLTLSGGRVDAPLLHIETNIDRESTLKSEGRFVLFPTSPNSTAGEFRVEKSASHLNIENFDIEDELSAFLTVDLEKEQKINGSVVANGFDISRLIVSRDSSLAGKIDADLKLDGTLNAPQLDGYMHADGLLYNDVGPYESTMNFRYDSTLFTLDKFLLNFGKSTLLYAQGQYDVGRDDVNFTIQGAGFDAGHVLGAAGKDSLLSGEMLVDLGIAGPLKMPNIHGVVAIKNGKIGQIPFDEVELKLGASEDSSNLRSPSIFVDNFRLSRFNVYKVLAHGSIPYRNSDTLSLDIDGEGNFLQILNDLTPYFKSPHSVCELQGRIRGTPAAPRLEAATLTIEQASMDFKSVVSPISDVRAKVSFEADEQFINVAYLEGNMGKKPFRIHNELARTVVSEKPLQNIHIGDSDFHFGVIVAETPNRGVPLNFVGLMEPNEFGMLELLGRTSSEKFYFAAVPDGLTLRGRIYLYDTEIMYPFYDDMVISSSKTNEFLRNLHWDLYVVPAKNTRFVRNFAGAIDEVYVDLKLDEGFGGLEFTDQLQNETFRINGHVRSTKGFIEYLDMNFRVEQAGVDFDRSSLVPVAYGTAKTTVTDSLGISSNIVLTLQTVDNTMDKKSVDDIVREEEGRARFNQIRFKLSSDNPNLGSTESQILASLGYSSNNLQNSAISAIGYSTDNLIFRPLFRPVEKELEQTFGFDYVRFSSQLTRNIIMFNLNNNLELNNRLALLESTKIIVGKYLANHFFLQYTGQLESGVGYRYKEKHLGLHHTIGLEYQLSPQVLVELEYVYDSLMLENRDDKRIVLRHWFPF